jgi:hypothetical protein
LDAPVEKKKLGELLIERGLITIDQLNVALDYQKKDPRSLGEILHSFRLLTEEELLKVLSIELGTEYFPTGILLEMDVPANVLDFIPREKAAELMVVPIAYTKSSDRLLVAMAYPQKLEMLESVAVLAGVKKIEPCLCFEATLYRLLNKLYGDPPKAASSGDEATDDGFFLGSDDDTEAFPGIYGHGMDEELIDSGAEAGDGFFLGGEDDNRSGVSGNLMDLGLLEMLQIMGASNKTCLIQIRKGDENADIFMEGGRIVNAKLGDIKGEAAFFAVIGWSEGHFQIKTDALADEKLIARSLDGLILEGLRLLDEQAR